MSLKSWIDEFYPVEFEKVEEKDAVAHSLQKWRGLTKENLAKHGLTKINGDIWDEEIYLPINDNTCALCHFYISLDDSECVNCPLNNYLGFDCSNIDEDGKEPYDVWLTTGNPQPMIEALEACNA